MVPVEEIASITDKQNASLKITTLGSFELTRGNHIVTPREWGRDKTVQLFQFLLTSRKRGALHKEQIMERLWEDFDDQGFKVALHGINKVLEPSRKSRSESKYIIRQGVSYFLDTSDIWIDAEAMEQLIVLGNSLLNEDQQGAEATFREALTLHQGAYLPNRLYEDWSSSERERLQILAIGTYVQLAQLLLNDNPMESLRLCKEALLIDNSWEEAYRVEMQAYLSIGNRPKVIKTYERCRHMLQEEFGLEPLPTTRLLYEEVKNS